MDLHRPILFVHVAAVVGLFATLSIEWVSLRFLRRATSYEQARQWTRAWRLLIATGALAVLTALASGIYLATSLGVWSVGWVAVAIPTIVAVAIVGGLTAPARNRLVGALAVNSGPLPDDVQRKVTRPVWLAASLHVRTALLCGLLYEMTVRPEAGVATMGIIGLVGVAWAIASRW
jgi:hypothetical protein